MRRLYLQIYAAFLAILVLFAVIASLVWWFAHPDARGASDRSTASPRVLGELLPAPGAPPAELEPALQRLASDFSADVELRGPDGARLAAVGEPLPAPPGRPARERHPARRTAGLRRWRCGSRMGAGWWRARVRTASTGSAGCW